MTPSGLFGHQEAMIMSISALVFWAPAWRISCGINVGVSKNTVVSENEELVESFQIGLKSVFSVFGSPVAGMIL